jgi:hypothetical protein
LFINFLVKLNGLFVVYTDLDHPVRISVVFFVTLDGWDYSFALVYGWGGGEGKEVCWDVGAGCRV